jgi:apolipoprotein N-acyltransferase
VALVALVPLLLAVETLRPRQAAALGYLTGLVFIALLILWIPTEFLSWTGAAGWLAWLALCVAEACFVAAFAALVPACRRLGPWRLLLLPACWATLELLRAHAPLGGFPWGILGVSQHGGGPLLPLARVVGAYGLSAVIVAVNLAVAAWIRALAARGSPPPGPQAPRGWPGWPGWRSLGRVVAWPVLAVALTLSGLLAPAPPPSGAPLRLAVIQAGLLGGHGLDRGASTEAVFSNHLARTEALAGQLGPDLVIWGEGSVDEDPLTSPDRLERIRRAARRAGAPLLVGATTAAGGDHYATDALLFTERGELAGRYRKRRLVPFGEYVPMASLMGRVLPVTREGVPFDKVPGGHLEPIAVGGVRVGTIICWESAYAEDPRTLVREGAQVVVVATNNASFGEGPASRQHLASSQLRAVEEGRTVVQAAVSGSSAVIGPDGVARQQTGLYQQATIRAAVAPRRSLTLYARFGQGIEWVLTALAVATLVIAVTAATPAGQRRRFRGAPGGRGAGRR